MKAKLENRHIGLREILRDMLVACIPLESLPHSWIVRFYGFEPKFVFITHPRSISDIHGAFPIFNKLRQFIPERIILWLLARCPCYVIANVICRQRMRGLVVSTTHLPSELFANNGKTMATLEKVLNFIGKMSHGNIHVSLGAWWPIVTDNGLECNRLRFPKKRVMVTNGHCATLASIYLTIQKVAHLVDIPLRNLDVLIIGVGRMGAATAYAINGKVRQIGLVDRDPRRVKTVGVELRSAEGASAVEWQTIPEDEVGSVISSLAERYHIVVCTTSSLGYLVKRAKSLKNCFIIDDARPEAFPRVFDTERGVAVIEGGLIHIKGAQLSYDFGFGREDNVFGCLAEAFILALDGCNELRPTLGDVRIENFQRMLDFFQRHNIREGSFKCGPRIIEDKLAKQVLLSKFDSMRSSTTVTDNRANHAKRPEWTFA